MPDWLFSWLPRLPTIVAGVLTSVFCYGILFSLLRLRRSDHKARNILHAEAMVIRAIGREHGVDPTLIQALDQALTDSGEEL